MSFRSAVFVALAAGPAVVAAQTSIRKDAPASADRAAIVARIDSLAQAYVAAGQTPSTSIAVVRGRDTLVMRGYGVADAEQRTPAGPATVYQIGSVTKQFTSALVMRLVERGTVSLDDPISRHVASLPAAWQPVTVRQLLNHTSGIPSYTNVGPRWLARAAQPMMPDSIAAITAADTMEFAPGAGWNYNNTGYVLLGILLERKFGRPYAELVRTELAAPLGLTATRYCGDADTTAATVARGYAKNGATFARAQYLHMSQPYAAGALCSTAGDLARWNRLLATGGVVRPASYVAMTTPAGARGGGRRYGFGLAVDTLAGHPVVTHGGGIFGFITANAYFPNDSLSVTVLTNGAPNNPDRLLQNLARAALGVPIEREAATVTLTAADRARYVGTYTLQLPNATMPFRVFEQGDKLFGQGQAEGQGAFELLPRGAHAFGAAIDPSIRVTFTVEGERATKFTLEQGGGRFEAPRVP